MRKMFSQGRYQTKMTRIQSNMLRFTTSLSKSSKVMGMKRLRNKAQDEHIEHLEPVTMLQETISCLELSRF